MTEQQREPWRPIPAALPPRLHMSCCGDMAQRFEVRDMERAGCCGFCGAIAFEIFDTCDTCEQRFPYRDVHRASEGKWCCRGCMHAQLASLMRTAESYMIQLGARAYSQAPPSCARQLEDGFYRVARVLERMRQMLEGAAKGWQRTAAPAKTTPPGMVDRESRLQGFSSASPFSAGGFAPFETLRGVDFSKPASGAERLRRAGFKPYGRRGWWWRGGASPRVTRADALRTIDHEFQRRAHAWLTEAT